MIHKKSSQRAAFLKRIAFYADDAVDRFDIVIDIGDIPFLMNHDFRFHDRKFIIAHIIDPDGMNPDFFAFISLRISVSLSLSFRDMRTRISFSCKRFGPILPTIHGKNSTLIKMKMRLTNASL